jgi:hypothetical protein
MRCGRSPEIVKNGDKIVGFFTGADFCAEHEQGIDRLRSVVGCKEVDVTADGCESFGISNRLIDGARFDSASILVIKRDFAVLIVRGWWNQQDKDAMAASLAKGEGFPHDLFKPKRGEKDKIFAAWSNSDLGICVGKDYIPALKALYDACIAGHGFIGTSRQLPLFDNGGIVLADSRNIPANLVADMETADRDANKLYIASRATGIEARLHAHNKAAGGNEYGSSRARGYAVMDDGTVLNKDSYNPCCGWYALSPKWAGFFKNADGTVAHPTKHPVMYWLNPTNQEQNGFGWMTVEDLEEWMAGKGKIPGKGSAFNRYQRVFKALAGDTDAIYHDEVCCKDCKEISHPGKQFDRGWWVPNSATKCPLCGSENIIRPVTKKTA